MSYTRFGFGYPRGQRSPRWKGEEESLSRSVGHTSNPDFDDFKTKGFRDKSDRYKSFGRSRRNFYQNPRSHYQGLRRRGEAGRSEGRDERSRSPLRSSPPPGREGGQRSRSPAPSHPDDPAQLKSWSPGGNVRSGEPGWKQNGKDGTGGRHKEGEGECKDLDERAAFKELATKRGAGGGDTKKSPAKKGPASGEGKSDIIKCPHCGFSSGDSMEYKKHLFGVKHTHVMLGVQKQLTGVLTMMQSKVRKEEEKKKGSGAKDAKKKFCKTCKVSISSYSEHTDSFLHKKIVEFLKPFCKICDKAFETHSYEEHICHLEHIKRKMGSNKEVKRKAKDEVGGGSAAAGKGSQEVEGKEVSEKLPTKENNAVISSEGGTDTAIKEEVLSVNDEVPSENQSIKEGEEVVSSEGGGGEPPAPPVEPPPQETPPASAPETEAPQTEVDTGDGTPTTQVLVEMEEPQLKKTTEMKIGAEYCDLIDAYYCELCKQFVSSEILALEKARDRHCQSKAHLQRLMRVTKLEHRRSYAAKMKAKMEAEAAAKTKFN